MLQQEHNRCQTAVTENVNGGLLARGNTLPQRDTGAAVHGFRIRLGAGLARRGSRRLPQVVRWLILLLQRPVGAEHLWSNRPAEPD